MLDPVNQKDLCLRSKQTTNADLYFNPYDAYHWVSWQVHVFTFSLFFKVVAAMAFTWSKKEGQNNILMKPV